MYTMEDFFRDYFVKKFDEMTPADQQEFLRSVPLERRLAGVPLEQIQEYLDKLNASGNTESRKPRRRRKPT